MNKKNIIWQENLFAPNTENKNQHWVFINLKFFIFKN